MATTDLSRSGDDPKKRYRGVRMQQGRVLLDADFNSAAEIDHADRRKALLDVIGPYGSPDAGFAIDKPSEVAGEIDFDIQAGTFYLGGLRFDLDKTQTFRLQSDWLHQPATLAPTTARTDLIYLEAWQQIVSAVEDGELYEPALGGPDTITCLRNMCRVRQWTVTPSISSGECEDAWRDLTDEWLNKGHGTLSHEHELVPDTRLTVTPVGNSASSDPCAPQAMGGYGGPENEAIRVCLLGNDQFTWGFDNGAPLYRVHLTAQNTVLFDTEPADEAHRPKVGQVVEILPWSAVLSNGEILAEELEPGHLNTVSVAYDADSRELTLSAPVPNDLWATWTSRAAVLAKHGLSSASDHFFLRVWDRRPDLTSPASVTLTQSEADLGNTGLRIKLAGSDQRPGDSWTVAARPQTPNTVMPWDFQVARAPDGWHRYYAPLALIRWSIVNGQLVGKIEDCRKTFRPLTEIESCCTFTVGDGKSSYGDFTSVQAAVDRLPASGGEICVLRGTYEEHVTLDSLKNITIHGCGPRSLIKAKAGVNAPVFYIHNCKNVTLRSMAVEAEVANAIALEGDQIASGFGYKLKNVMLEDLDVAGRDVAAITCSVGRFITLRDCRVRIRELAASVTNIANIGHEPAVFMAGDDLTIRDNEISAASTKGVAYRAAGGCQVAGGSGRVVVSHNHIHEGNGRGITLGSRTWIPASTWQNSSAMFQLFLTNAARAPYQSPVMTDESGCVLVSVVPREPTNGAGTAMSAETFPTTVSDGLADTIAAPGELSPSGVVITTVAANLLPSTPVAISDGNLTSVQIVDNHIERMGADGIGVPYWDLLTSDDISKDIVAVDDLIIERNRIHDCLQLALGGIPPAMQPYSAYAGVALGGGTVITIRDNVIENNGTNHFDPICGIFILSGTSISIERNRIVNNGPRSDAGGSPLMGNRGGIVIGKADVRTVSVEVFTSSGGTWLPSARVNTTQLLAALPGGQFGTGELHIARQDGVPAARINENIVVAPEGRALRLVALGPVSVHGNQFTALGNDSLGNVALPGTPPSLGLALPKAATVSMVMVAATMDPITAFLDPLGGCTVAIVNLGTSFERTVPYRGAVSTALPADPAPPESNRLAAGTTMFHDNQVTLDALGAAEKFAFSSVLLASNDDISMANNQCGCAMQFDQLVTHAVVIGDSVRVINNKFKETMKKTRLSVFARATAFNTTTNNQATHCIIAYATDPKGMTTATGNQVLVTAIAPSYCTQTYVVDELLAGTPSAL